MDIYLRVARDYGIASTFVKGLVDLNKVELSDQDIQIDNFIGASEEDFAGGMDKFYARTFRNLQPGVTFLSIHCAFDDLESQGMAHEHPSWGSEWRQADYDFFMSDECQRILEEENIQLITWREIQEKLKG